MELYQSLVAVNPVTLIASICNLFIQLFLFKKLFWDKILNILDQRRQAADQEISDAKAAHAEADAIKATYEENMRQAKEKADSILMNAQKTATLRSELPPHRSNPKLPPTLPWRRKRPSTTPRTKSPAWLWPLPARWSPGN